MEELKKLFLTAKNPNEIGATLIGNLARKELKQFFDFFRQDYAERIDWDKGYEIMDEDLSKYISKRELKKKDTSHCLVKAFDKDGDAFRFIVTTIVDIKKGHIKVGIAEIPDENEEQEDIENMDEEDILNMFAKNFLAKLKSGKLKPLDDTPNCSRCGRSDLPLTITVDAVNMKTQKICSVCMSTGGAQGDKPKEKTVAQIDKEIADYEELAHKYEQLIKDFPQPDNIPAGLEKYAITPMSSYRSIQAVLADLKARRMQAMTSMESITRLEYELKQALEAEEYEKSAELRDKINQLRGKKK